MAETTNGSLAIQTGTAEGLLEFLDYVVAKGYGPATALGPQKSAVKQVIATVEGEEFDLTSLDIRSLDLADFLSRFEIRARGQLKAESIGSYRQRTTRAVEAYLEFLETGKPPSYRSPARRRATTDPAETTTTKRTPSPVLPTTTPAVGTSERMVDYPFPLKSGVLANLRLPVRLEKEDAERMGAFIRTLVFEGQKELPRGSSSPEEE